MDDNFFWNVFKNTGSVESYLAYKQTGDQAERKPQDESQNTGFDFKEDQIK